MEEIGISIISKLAEYLVDPAIREARYLFCVRKIVRNQETQKKELLITQGRVQKRVEDALRKIHEIEDPVKKWLDEVKDLIAEAEKLQQDLTENKGCFPGWCPTLKRYCPCKQLEKKTMAMTQLNSTSDFNPFSHPAPIPDIEYFSSRNFMSFKATKLAFDEILKALRDDNCYMIGLYGMGGSGKTTLAKELGKKAKEEKLFDHVAFATVSQPPNVRKIQGEIADLLGVELEKESDAGRARKIAMKLRSKERILVVLDDVWTVLNLEDIGIPCDGSDNNCKVLLTTRRQQVCNLMICQRKIQLGLLSEDEAWILFQHHANVDNMTHVVAQEICKECKGLPIAIVAVGRCLKGKGINEMNFALYKLRHSEPIDVDEGEKDAFSCLRLSYEYLRNEEAKLLFLICAMFPEDHNISRENLFRYGKGLGLCKEVDSFDIARSQVNIHIDNLIDSCLLTHSENKDDHFKMHDMVRDVALWIGSKQDRTILENPAKELNAFPEDELKKDMEAVCLWYEQTDSQPEASKLKILVPNLKDKLDLSFALFEDKMQKVVALKSRYVLHKLRTIESTQWLANLQTLRLVRLTLSDISFVASLRRLEILDLHWSTFEELPDGVKKLNKLKLLDLSNCDIKEPCRVIGRCSKLQELYTLSDYGNVEVPWECLNSDTFPKLERYHLKVGPYPRPSFYGSWSVSSSTFLNLIEFNVSTLGATVKDLLKRANNVGFDDLQGGCKNIFPEMDQAVGGMNELSDLMLANCKEIECLVSTTASQASSSRGLPMLIPVCPKSRYLKRLEISSCPKLTTLFPMSVAQTLVQLQELSISFCNELRHIMINEEEIQFQTDNSCLMFQQLKKLDVSDCENLECIFPISCSHDFSQLEVLGIVSASRLKYVFGTSNCAFSRGCNLSSLKQLWIIGCPLLTSLFPTSVAQTLLQLERIGIAKCIELKHIVATEKGDSLEFPRLKLELLDLRDCPKLPYVFPISCIQSLVNLVEVFIEEVSGLEYIFGPDDCENRSTNENEIQIVFPLLRIFYLNRAPNLLQILPANFRSRFPELLILENCPKLTTVGFNPECAGEVIIRSCGVENLFHVQRIGLDEDQQQLRGRSRNHTFLGMLIFPRM